MQESIPYFNGHYDHWCMLMEKILRSKEYFPIVDDGIGVLVEGDFLTNAQKAEFEERKLKDLEEKNHRIQSTERPFLKRIICKKNFQRYMELNEK